MSQQVKMRLMEVSPMCFLAEPIHQGDPEVPPPHPVEEPELVILFGWMGASHVHLQKYTDAYRLLFPAASIMLIRSSPNAFLRSSAHARAALRPAHALLAARYHSVAPGPSSPILVHTFSNGGSINLQHLVHILINIFVRLLANLLAPQNTIFKEGAAKAKGTGKKGETTPLAPTGTGPEVLPARAFVFDSCPGKASLSKAVAAFTAPYKSAWAKIPASLIVGALYCMSKAWYFVTRQTNPIDSMYSHLATSLAPVPRLYIYGPNDQLIPSVDIEEHVAEVKSTGVEVRMERFEGTQHVAHLRGGSDRYWGAVKDIWLGRTA
ncbi:hypothetical protein RQP46_006285 [Phenoliferia psychrophenolica]